MAALTTRGCVSARQSAPSDGRPDMTERRTVDVPISALRALAVEPDLAAERQAMLDREAKEIAHWRRWLRLQHLAGSFMVSRLPRRGDER